LMDAHGILIYLFLYDDGAKPFPGGTRRDEVPAAERQFVEEIVRRFKHHRNLIWIVGEESEEAYTHARVRAIARVIQAADEHGHLIGSHHLSGTEFKAWEEGGPLEHYSLQLGLPLGKVHKGAVEAFEKARGKYQVIYSENTQIGTDPNAMRRFAWAAAMGGTMPMILKTDIENTPVALLRQCRYLQQFFESTDFYTMSPHDDLAHGSTAWVLADPGRSAIAYAISPQGEMGLKGLPAGRYNLTWLDCVNGRRVTQTDLGHSGGNAAWQPPKEVGDEIAVWIRAADTSVTADDAEIDDNTDG